MLKSLLGSDHENSRLYSKENLEEKEDTGNVGGLPTNFDAREKWPNCTSLSEIRGQSHCGSCWAFGSVEAITDRMCIHLGKPVHLSAKDILSF